MTAKAAPLDIDLTAVDEPNEFVIPGLPVLALDEIRPYWRNPRTITEQSVGVLVDMITRYGYQQPITVDTEHVIITGHTRYAALRKLGATAVSVIVSDLDPENAKQYRVMDNRSAEYTSWDVDALMLELREFEASLLEQYFPEVDLEIGEAESLARITDEEVAAAEESIADVGAAEVIEGKQVTCPACYHEFLIKA